MFTSRKKKWNLRWFGGATAFLLAICLTGTPAMGDQDKPTDRSISDQVEHELMFDQGVISPKISVNTSQGIVTLKGTVNNILAKERAARLAETVRGVRSVVNRISVSPVITRADDEVESNIESAWLTDPATESYEIKAVVNDGMATLTGTVQSYQEKELAATVAKGVSGVRDVKNVIRIVYETERSGLEIKNEIEQALKWNLHVDHGHLVNVEVDDGQVTLSASVGSAAEKNRIRNTAWVAGVHDVDVTGITVRDWLETDSRRNEQFPDVADSEIRNAIRDALLYDPRVNMFNVDVDVTTGRAILRGTVGNLKARRAAIQDARNTYGVWHVYDRLKVRSENKPSDAEIRQRIEAAFARDAFVESYEVRVAVNEGIVDLYGTVNTYFEKSQADDVASRINGVLFVDNNLVVSELDVPYVYDPYVDSYSPYDFNWYQYEPQQTGASDTEIKDDITDEMWWSPFVDADEVTVVVNNGVATLTGEVDSWYERQSALENAIEGGATRVINNLKVN